MKCKKCGKEVGATDKKCSNCGTVIDEDSSRKSPPELIIPNVDDIEDFTMSKIDIYQKEYKDKKNNSFSKKKPLFWVLLFGGEFLFLFVIPIILIIALLFFNVSKLNEVDYKQFKKVLLEHEYEVEKLDTNSYQDIKDYYVASKNGYMIQYIQANSVESASNHLEKIKESGNFSSTSVVEMGKIYESFYSDQSDYHYSIVRIKDTVIFSAYPERYEEDVMVIYKELGYELINMRSFFVVFTIVYVLFFGLLLFLSWKIFTKAGEKGWYIFIPFYNAYVLNRIVYQKTKYFLLFILPLLGLFFVIPLLFVIPFFAAILFFIFYLVLFLYIISLSYKIPKVFGKNKTLCILNVFFPSIIMQIIALDNSIYLPDRKSDKLF